MNTIILYYTGILALSFYMLIKSSEHLVSSSANIGKRFGLNDFIIGLTIIAVGTSLPEFFTAIISIFSSSDPASFIMGTVIGSNISNILFIFGILVIFSKKFNSKTSLFDKTILAISSLAVIFVILFKQLNMLIGIVFILSYALYLTYKIRNENKEEIEQEAKETEESKLSKLPTFVLFLILAVSLLILNLGAKGVIVSIENIGNLLKIPTIYLTLSTVAFATSLPEAMVTYTCAKSKNFDIAIGNILGSNISNVFFILGVSGILKNISLNITDYVSSIIFLAIATTLFIILISKKKVSSLWGIISVVLYMTYIGIIFF